MGAAFQKRDLFVVILLLVVTLGLYFIYWGVKTKGELCRMGAEIPTAWFLIIPFAHFYFWYKYAEAFTAFIKKGSDPVIYFLLMALVPWVGVIILQSEFNKIAQ
jgi:hypothetical protein